jgi:hypothetical protein
MYLNSRKKMKNTTIWDRVFSVITGNILRCRFCQAIFSNTEIGKEQFIDHEADFHNEYFPKTTWTLSETPYKFDLIKNYRVCILGCRFNLNYQSENDLRMHYILWHSYKELQVWGFDRNLLKMHHFKIRLQEIRNLIIKLLCMFKINKMIL